MPIRKYRDLDSMRRDLLLDRPQGEELDRRIAALWRRSWEMAPKIYPRGVFKFHSIEEAQAARQEITKENALRLRRERGERDPLS